MTTLLLVACVGMITGAFLILRISPMDFTQGIFQRLTSAPRSIRSEINEVTRRKKKSFLRREIEDAQTILKATGKEAHFPVICAVSLLLFSIGASIAIVMDNFFLVPVMAVGMMFIPFWYVKLTAGNFKKDVSAELETALSIITTAYLRSEDFLTAVGENISYLNQPVCGVFQNFLNIVERVDPDMDAALGNLRNSIDNEVFREWCDAVLACQYDRGLKTTLTPIVSKLSDMRIVNGELENLVFGPRKEFITMAALVVLNIPLLKFINANWYAALMHTVPGQIVLAICAAAIFISFAFVVKLTQPIEYRR
jgi:Flp pilus assembly protein TadB